MAEFFCDINLTPVGGWGGTYGTAPDPAAFHDLMGFAPAGAGDVMRITNGQVLTLDPDDRPAAVNLHFEGWDGGEDGLNYDCWRLWNAPADPWNWFTAGNQLYNGDIISRLAAAKQDLVMTVAAPASTLQFRCCVFQNSGTLVASVWDYGGNTIIYDGCTFDCRILSIEYAGTLNNTWLFRDCLFAGCLPTRVGSDNTVSFYRCVFTKTEAQVRAMMPAGTLFIECRFEIPLRASIPPVNEIVRGNLLFSQFGLPKMDNPAGVCEYGFDGVGDRQGAGAFYFGLADAAASATPTHGRAPLDVDFTGNTDDGVESHHWDFGDGTTSDEQNPSHTYDSPGVYEVTYTITDGLGDTSTVTLTIYVYNWDYERGYVVSKTDFCARMAMPNEPAQGVGWSIYSGQEWPLAIGRVGTLEIMNAVDEHIPLVIDCNTFRLHELGGQEFWRDGEAEYAGAEIRSEILLPEVAAPVGAAAVLRHSQTHVIVKPWYKDRRSVDDYDEIGYRQGFQMDLFARVDSSPDDYVITERVPKEGQIVFDRHFLTRFVQFGVRPEVAPWRIPKIQSWLVQEDVAAGPDDKIMSETTWGLEWSEPVLWLSRDLMAPLRNRATGGEFDGGYIGRVAGPDGYAGSALVVSGGLFAAEGECPVLDGDFTMCWWLRGAAVALDLYRNTGLLIEITYVDGRYRLRFNDATNNIQVWLDRGYSDWTMLSIVRSGSNLIVYENGVVTNTVVMADAYITYGGEFTALCDGGSTLWDMRMVSRAVGSDAQRYFYTDVVEHAGNAMSWIW
jgi:PKD repeat protein